ncbi:PucR family transcriptional regulator ligand-binding domain-containing protein [Lutibacter sp. B2]|nr:PucR family transcriptional regulator ligand-binding domain-containing protein [Lutibacter sp. B2]
MDKLFGISVKELLNLEILKNAKIIAGEGGLNRRITKVNVMEVPDILEWVSSGEFLFTTAYSIKDNIKKLNELISDFDTKGLAGIGIKTKRYIKEIPAEIITIANNLKFPIIEIPNDISYSEIIMPALTEIINNQTNTLLKIDNIHNRLINVMLEGGGLMEIGEAIYKSINNSLVIKENIFKTHVTFCEDDIRSDIEDIISKVNYESEDINIFEGEKSSYFRAKDTIKGKTLDRIRIPIYTKGTNYGDLFIWKDKKELSSVELTVIKASISIIALDLIKKLSIFEMESKHKIEFFDDLFSSDNSRQKRAMERAQFFDFDKNLSYVAIVIVVNNKEKEIKLTPNNTDFLHQLNGKLLSIVKRLTIYRKEKIIYGNKSDRLIILFGSEATSNSKNVRKEIFDFCNQILSLAELEYIKENISIGIGRQYDHVNELYKTYREASRAAEKIGASSDCTPVHYDDLGIYRILSHEGLKPEIVQFYKEMLEPLVIYDRDKGSEFVKTLEAYFKCRGNLKRISETMYTHYNTIIYRIQRIKDITGIDFDNYNDVLNIQIALKIFKMIKDDG